MTDKVYQIEKDIEQLGLKIVSIFVPASRQIKSSDVNSSEKSSYSPTSCRGSQSQN